MRIPKLILAVFAVLLFSAKTYAQVDSTHFDLGRTQIKKDFTQHITVKGSDLEKMPFDNLADAINAWFYGAYTTKTSLVYVIDGNLVNDVNAYSIYDIDEITLVQNAITQISGTTQQQQMVLIKTKRSKFKGLVVEANGKAGISSLYTNNIIDNTIYYNVNTPNSSTPVPYKTGQKSTTIVYQQYDVSARGNTGNIQYGLSADYLRDALPIIKDASTTYNAPYSLSRLRFNGYFDAKLGNSTLDVTAGYAPQTENNNINTAYPYGSNAVTFKQTESLFNGSVRLTTHIVPGLVNDLHADYNHYHYNSDYSQLSTNTTSSVSTELSSTINGSHDHDIVAYDNLSYTAKFGDWTLEPAANISFKTFRDSIYYRIYTSADATQPLTLAGGGYSRVKQHMFLLTPSVNLFYKSYFNIEAGLLYNLNVTGEYISSSVKEKKVFPFVTASADITRLINPASNVALKVYASYSLTDHLADNSNTLQDFDLSTTQIPILGSVGNSQTSSYPSYGTVYNVNYASDVARSTKSFYNFSAGLTLSPQKSDFVFSYFFDKRTYLGPIIISLPAYTNEVQYQILFYNVNSTVHSFSVDYKLFKSASFNWTTGLNTTMIKQTYSADDGYDFKPNPVEGSGEWTGGWVNRLSCHDFFAGADLLYEINGRSYTETNLYDAYIPLITHRADSFSLQNLYAGYMIKAAGLKNLEVFANARNLFQNQKEIITDNRKYYGLGFKVIL